MNQSIDISSFPSTPGVYQMRDESEKILYVGKAKNLKKRVASYLNKEKLSLRLKRMVSLIHSIDFIVTENESSALLLECNLIKKHKPPYNILLKDDKSYPFILMTKNHPFPRITKHRGKQKIDGDYFGPFASSHAVYETISQIQKIFKIRSCTDSYYENTKKPCLQYHLKRCLAPCVKSSVREDYEEMTVQAIEFLKGKNDKVQSYLAKKMQAASDVMNFEKAALYRDQIQSISKLQKQKTAYVEGLDDVDVIGFEKGHNKICVQVFMFRFGQNLGNISFVLDFFPDEEIDEFLQGFLMQFYQDKTPPSSIFTQEFPLEKNILENVLQTKIKRSPQALHDFAKENAKQYLSQFFLKNMSMIKIFEEMVVLFDLPLLPSRIEVYDNTHNHGQNAYSAMIVANQDGFDKKNYRKFTMDSDDDFEMMRSVMRRRFAHAQWDKPDLIIVDGGIGQLNAVVETLNELGLYIPCIAMSKGVERKVGQEKYITINHVEVMPSVTLSYFLQNIRDEAHRFAIGAHRHKGLKNLKKSALDEISGIGPKRKKALLQHFGSLNFIKEASLDDLQKTPHINHLTAQKIYDFFNQK
jgi:excinuclease ABC subunit C